MRFSAFELINSYGSQHSYRAEILEVLVNKGLIWIPVCDDFALLAYKIRQNPPKSNFFMF